MGSPARPCVSLLVHDLSRNAIVRAASWLRENL